mgnify:CR=1 FL=1
MHADHLNEATSKSLTAGFLGMLGAADGGYIPLDDPYRVRGSEKLWGERDQAVMMEFMLRTGYNAHKCKMGAK